MYGLGAEGHGQMEVICLGAVPSARGSGGHGGAKEMSSCAINDSWNNQG